MNNEEAAEHLRLILDEGLAGDANYDDKGKDAEAVRLAIAALRTPPATGAAQREACAAECDALQHDFKIEADDAQRKGLFNQENDYAMRSYGARACAAAIRALPAPEVPECHGCKHWTISPYARDFEKQNQYGYCRGMRACGVEIETTGDCSVDAIGTDATFCCKGWEAR